VLAGTYISRTSVEKYQQLYENSWNVLHTRMRKLHDYPHRTIANTWMISYTHLSKVNKPATKLLRMWGYLDNRDLWYGLLCWRRHQSNVPDWLRAITESEFAFLDAIEALLDQSLIEQVEESNSYAMHSVIHDWIRSGALPDDDDDVSPFTTALTCVGLAALPYYSDKDPWILRKRLLPHADRLLDQMTIPGALEILVMDIAAVDGIHGLGHIYHNQGQFKEAEKLFDQALEKCHKMLEPDHELTLSTIHSMGFLYYNQGRLKKAEQMYERALEGYENAPGRNDTSVFDTLHHLGVLYGSMGRLVEAEQTCNRALEGRTKAYGSDHWVTLETVTNLGTIYAEQGRLIEAEQMHNRALRGQVKAFGSNHISTLETIGRLGWLYKALGRLPEAEQMLIQVVQGYEKALGPDHPHTLTRVYWLADFYESQEKPALAILLMRRCFGNSSFFLSCNSCHTPIVGASYHCDICAQGDFDLCGKCVPSDWSCSNGHKLRQRIFKDGEYFMTRARSKV
jgi:tetratricopeptide (TPR) repeat protein